VKRISFAIGALFGAGVTALLYASAMLLWISVGNLPHHSTPAWTGWLCAALTLIGAVAGGVLWARTEA
jgi:hypothetical protein